VNHGNFKKNEGAKIMSIEERTVKANERINAAENRRRQEERATQEAQRRRFLYKPTRGGLPKKRYSLTINTGSKP